MRHEDHGGLTALLQVAVSKLKETHFNITYDPCNPNTSYTGRLFSCCCVNCNKQLAPGKKSDPEKAVSINLRHLGVNQTQVFQGIERAQVLPKAVLLQLGKISEAGQPFNATDLVDPKLPTRQFVAGALSQQYCAVSYWQGGMILEFQTIIFKVSEEDARPIWLSLRQGGFNLADLKAIIE